MKVNKSLSRFIALVLSIALVLTMRPVTVSAETEGCIHEHNTECGYVEGVACSHTQHDESGGCVEAVSCGSCTHTQHDEACGYIEAAPCRHVHDENCGGLIDSGKMPGESGDTVTVAAFDELDEEILWQGYAYGTITSSAALTLPNTLNGTDVDDNSITIEGVTWESEPEFDPAVSAFYDFSPVLPDGYILSEGATAPVISVFIQPEGGVQIGLYSTASDLVTAISTYGLGGGSGTALSASETSTNVVTVTGNVTSATNQLTLTIDSGVTVVWKATISGDTDTNSLVRISGSGVFEVDSGGTITATSGAVYVNNTATVVIDGGAIESSKTAISVDGSASVIVKSGTVSGTGAAKTIDADGTNASVTVEGGTVTASTAYEYAIRASGSAATVAITGGEVKNTATAFPTYCVNISSTGSVYYSSGIVANNGITTSSGNGYYIGSDASKFGTGFTTTNLFKLDDITLTANSLPYTQGTSSSDPVIASFSDKLNLSSAAITVSSNADEKCTISGGTVTFNQAMSETNVGITVTGAKIDGTNIPVTFTINGLHIVVTGSAPMITISAHPAQTTNVTQNAITESLTVTASVTQGGTLTYQWYSNTAANKTGGTLINGETNDTFTIPTSLTEGTYYYFCEVSATGAVSVRSDVATVTVEPPTLTGLSIDGGTTNYSTANNAQSAIQNALYMGDVTVTGVLYGIADAITLNIPANRKVTWQAEYSNTQNAIMLQGAGTLEIATGGKVNANAVALLVQGANTVTVSGEVSTGGNPYAIYVDGSGAAVTVATGGVVSATHADATAISLADTATNTSLTVDGGTVNAVRTAIEALDHGAVTIKSGTVKSVSGDYVIGVGGSSTLSVSGGNISNGTYSTEVVTADDTSTVFVSGGTIVAGGIHRHGSATGYYTSNNSSLFDTTGTYKFTQGTDLFVLDVVESVTANNQTHNGSTSTHYDVVAALSPKLDLSSASVSASQYTPTLNNTAKTVTFTENTGGAQSVTLTVSGAKISGTNIEVPDFTTAAFDVNIDRTLGGSVSVTSGTSAGNAPQVGDVLTADLSLLTPAAGDGRPALEYQWQYSADNSNWTNISGATSASYTVVLDYSNKYIRVVVKATAASGFTGEKYGNAGQVAKAAMQGSVSITVGNEGGGTAGVAEEGDVLTAVITGITPTAAQSGVTYSWSGGDTGGATTSTYPVTQNDEDTRANITVTVTSAVTGDYTGSLSASVMAGKIPVTINELTAQNSTYDGSVHTGYTGTASFVGGTPSIKTLTPSYAGRNSTSYTGNTPPTNAGDYTVTLTLADDPNYTGTLDLDFSIGKKTLTWNSNGTVQSKSYDGSTSATVATQPTLNGVIEGDDVTATSGTVVYTSANVGTSIGVTAAGYDINDTTGNYAALTSQPVFANGMISPILITITPNAGQSKIYGANDSVSYIYTNTTLINGDTISGALSRESGEDVGTYTYTLGTLSAGSNYLLTVDETNTYSITTATFVDTLPTVNRNVIIGGVRTITIPTTELTPTPAVGKSLGTVNSYMLDSYSAGNVSDSAEISGGNLTITSKSNLAQANISETINVKVSTQNYGDITVTVTLQTVDKADVSNKIAFVEGSKSYTGSVQTYETATISDMEQGVNHQWTYTYAVAQDDSGNGSLGGTNKPLTAGTYTVTATYEDDINIGTATATFTINKAVQTAPIAPVPDNITADMVTLKKPDGMTADAEYMQGPSGTWQTNADFSGLTPNTAYSFYMRLAETANYKASPASPAISVITEKAALTGTVTISGTAKFNQTLTAHTASLTTDPAGAEKGTLSYQWKRSGTAIAGANNATYVIMGADIDKTITVTVTTLNCIGEVTSSATLVVGKADAPNITWPTANGVTYGQTLSDSTLSFTSSEYGTFAWTDPSISPVRNNNGYSVTFTPFNDTIANYETITITTQPVAVDVAAKNVSSLTIEPIDAVTYNGTSHEPIPDQDIIVKDGNITLTSATDYTVTYSDNIFAGTANVTITGAGNYTGTKGAEFTIYKAAPAQLTWPAASDLTYGAALSMSNLTGGSTTGTWAWTDSSIIPTVINSGYNVTFTPADTANYDWSGVTLTQAVNIQVSKAGGLTVSTEPAMNAREGIGPVRNYSFDMNNITLNKGDTGVKTYSAVKDTDGNNILSNITVTNNILTYDIAGTAAVGDTATIAITIESDNYTDITAILTITVTVKDTQTIRFQEAALTKTYGDAKFTAAATLDGSGGTGTVTYTSDNTNVATVNAATGEVTIVGVGSANITARKAEDADWFEATASYTLTVTKASQTAPGGIGKTNETAAGANDGTMTGVTTAMEYKRNTDTVYTPIPGTTVTELPPGTYYVRYASTTNHNPGPDTVITIAAYTAPITETPSSDSKGSIVENNHYGTAPEAPKFWGAVNTDIGKDISANTEDSNYNVVTGRNIVIPTFILETLQDSNTTLAMHTGMGVTFSITGSDIPDHTNIGTTVNLTVRQGELTAPEALIREKTKDTIRSIEIPMESHESFGMTVNVHFSLGTENADNYANLYRYNEQTGAFEYLGSYQINEDGQAMFGITGGADFLLTVTAEKPNEVIVPMSGETYIVKPGDTLSGTAVKYGMSVAQIMALNPEIKNSSRIRPGQKIRVR